VAEDPNSKVARLSDYRPQQSIDGSVVDILREIIAGIEDGTVTSIAIVAKQNSFSRWSSWRASNSLDAHNLLGQLYVVQHEITEEILRRL
jgi:hypothetical protein